MTIIRGSEWRRWELHLHTPFTKKEDRYQGNSEEEKWDNFYVAVANYIGDGKDPLRSICAIAITDYLSTDNYFKVLKDNKLPQCIKLVLPNVEMRMIPIAKDAPINIHCLFSPDIALDLNRRFFSKLKFNYQGQTYDATRESLICLGKAYKNNENLNEGQALIEGITQYMISHENLRDIFNDDPNLREKTIIVVSNRSGDGVSGLKEHSSYFVGNVSQLDATRRTIYQFADAIFSSNEKDIQYFLGLGSDTPHKVIEKCGSLKPCIHGCDAHCGGKVFAPEEDRFCWIKADPTFDGLRQIIYEPQERVRISSTFPDSKPDYYVIDRVVIDENNDFSPEPIYFSDKLTCIIGGKSTGKSLLLHNIAATVDEEETRKRQEIVNTRVRPVSGLKVYWRDGLCSSDDSKQRKVVYIPQSYLNRLSDDIQETTEIDNIIQEIILQSDEANEAFKLFSQNISEEKQNIAKLIISIIDTLLEKNRFIEMLKNCGDRDSISEEINKLSKEAEHLSMECGITERDVHNYHDSLDKITRLEKETNIIKKELEAINEIISVIEIKANSSYLVLGDLFTQAISEVKKAADFVWHAQRERIMEHANKKLKELQIEIDKLSKVVTALKPHVEANERIIKISHDIHEEKEKLATLIDIEEKIKSLDNDYQQELNALSKSFERFSNIYAAYAESINTIIRTSQKDKDVAFYVDKVFRVEKFSQKVAEVFNMKTFHRFKDAFNLHEIREEDLTPLNLSKLIEAIFSASENSLQLKSQYSNNRESALREILTDWYNIHYTVNMDGDKIHDMSPGKKAIVLLKMLVSMADSKFPILIDQPEDDLDNRSVFDELIVFIKQKKINRQIIIVTHNANIVLGGDAELVIVANQAGKNSKNKKYRFEYRSGAIEDNSFDKSSDAGILNSKSVHEHICDILEGGKKAFELRQNKYHF